MLRPADDPRHGATGHGVMRTIDLARASGSHPNTVRLYEEWGFIPPAARAANGYRLWGREHLDQMLFARFALDGFWPGRPIRKSALALVRLAATGDLRAALAAADEHLGLVRGERKRAESAAACLEAWAAGAACPPRRAADGAEEAAALSKARVAADRVSAREAARLAEASPEQLRNWERNGLIDPHRDEKTGCRLYGEEEVGRARIIRALLLAGYSMMAIRRMVAELDGGRPASLAASLDSPREDEEVLTAFDRWLSFLAAQEVRAESLVGLLRARLESREPGAKEAREGPEMPRGPAGAAAKAASGGASAEASGRPFS
jgi:DNA-binding transcriptional MerR regulator